MSGGPLPQNQKDSGSRTINVRVEGGVHNGPILQNNDFQGGIKSVSNYTGPPPPQGQGVAQTVREDAADGAINIINRGGFTNQPIMSGNTVRAPVELVENINVQHPAPQDFPDRVNNARLPAAQNIVHDEDDGMDLK